MSDRPAALSCARCLFFEPLPVVGTVDLKTRSDQQGVCHRYPPTVTMTQGGLRAMFPQVTPAHWCGEIKIAGDPPDDRDGDPDGSP